MVQLEATNRVILYNRWLENIELNTDNDVEKYSRFPNDIKQGLYELYSKTGKNLLKQMVFKHGYHHGWIHRYYGPPININEIELYHNDCEIFSLRYEYHPKDASILTDIYVNKYVGSYPLTLIVKNMKIVRITLNATTFKRPKYPTETPEIDHISIYEWFQKIVF
jgi:hypothetical protein